MSKFRPACATEALPDLERLPRAYLRDVLFNTPVRSAMDVIERLLNICRILVSQTWDERHGAAFFSCERNDYGRHVLIGRVHQRYVPVREATSIVLDMGVLCYATDRHFSTMVEGIAWHAISALEEGST